MNKLSKLTALLLAIVLALGVPMQVMAEGEEIETWTEYIDIAKEALKTKIMAYETYGEYWDMVKLIEESDFEDFFYTLPLEDQHAIAKYVNDMFWASLVGYTNVAPFPELVETAAPASMLRLTARDGDTDSDQAKGLYTDKQVSGPDAKGYYTITLENYATGTVTTSTTTEIKPVDIVLVLDDSGSMKENLSETVYTEVAYNSMDHDNEYYVKNDDGSYTKVTWCDNRNCQAWTSGCYDFWGYHSGTKYTNKETFYELTVINHGTKGAALITAVNNFVDSVNANSPTEGTHQMSIVKFSGSSNGSKEATLLNGWTPVNADNVDDLKLTSGTNGDMKFNGGTYIDYGLKKAKSQLDTLENTGRQRVVIVFTDGIPGSGSWGNGNTSGEAVGVSAISEAKTIKAMENTTIYTVAVLQGANPAEELELPNATSNNGKINAILHAISSNYPDATATRNGTTLTPNYGTINELVDTNKNGSFDAGEPGYYLSASSASELNNIFQKISSNIQTGQSSVTLDEETIVRDVVTPYFEIPYVYKKDENGEYVLDENGEKIKDYTAAEITISEAQHTDESEGKPVFGTPTEVDYTYTINGNVLDVTGFDFAENAVMTLTNDGKTSYVGKKLIITFKIKPTDGFLGGNNVVTNDPSSGIYQPGTDEDGNPTLEPVEKFPEPVVDVDVPDLEIIGADQHIYLSNLADLDALLHSFQVQYWIKEGDSKYGIYTVDTILNHYTTLTFTLKDEQGNAVATYTIQAGKQTGTWTYNTKDYPSLQLPFEKDTTFYVSYEAISSNDSSNKSVGTLKATIYVYKPEVTFKDTQHDYLADLTAEQVTNYFDDENYVVTERKWYNESLRQYSTALQYMNGPEPDLIFTYAPVSATENNVIITPNEDGSGVISAVQCVPVNVKNVVAKSTYKDYSMDENNGPVETIVATNELDVSKVVKSYRQEISCDCAYDTPENKITDVLSDTVYEFVVHIKNAFSELKIIKKGLSVGESAIFTVTGYVPNGTADGKEQTWTVVLTATENNKEPSVTITGLLVGLTATVEEAGNWSWRYQTTQYEPSTQSVEIKPKTESTATITITNTNKNNQWLDDEVAVHNNFDENGTVTVID